MEPKSLLVVDDSSDFADIVNDLVKEAFPQCEVFKASDLDSAKKIIDEKPLEVVITDYLMGPHQGSDLVNYCRGTSINIVVLTGAAVNDVKMRVPANIQIYNKYSTVQNNKLISIIKKLNSLEVPL